MYIYFLTSFFNIAKAIYISILTKNVYVVNFEINYAQHKISRNTIVKQYFCHVKLYFFRRLVSAKSMQNSL